MLAEWERSVKSVYPAAEVMLSKATSWNQERL